MKKLLQVVKTRRSLLLASAFAPMCFGVLLAGAGPSRRQEDKRAPDKPLSTGVNIINKTTTLDATHQTTAGNHLLIRLRNVSSKDMNGYVVAVNSTRITNDLSIGDRFVSSGQTDELELPIRSSSTTLTILAAMFTDGSIEAEAVLKTELSEWRLGLKKELVRALTEVEEILNSSDVHSTKAIDRLSSRLSRPIDAEPGQSPSASGSQEARDGIHIELQSLKERLRRDGPEMQRQRVVDLKGRIERRIASL